MLRLLLFVALASEARCGQSVTGPEGRVSEVEMTLHKLGPAQGTFPEFRDQPLPGGGPSLFHLSTRVRCQEALPLLAFRQMVSAAPWLARGFIRLPTCVFLRYTPRPHPISPVPRRPVPCSLTEGPACWITCVVPAVLSHRIDSESSVPVQEVAQHVSVHQISRQRRKELRDQCAQVAGPCTVSQVEAFDSDRRIHHLVPGQISHGGEPGPGGVRVRVRYDGGRRRIVSIRNPIHQR